MIYGVSVGKVIEYGVPTLGLVLQWFCHVPLGAQDHCIWTEFVKDLTDEQRPLNSLNLGIDLEGKGFLPIATKLSVKKN